MSELISQFSSRVFQLDALGHLQNLATAATEVNA